MKLVSSCGITANAHVQEWVLARIAKTATTECIIAVATATAISIEVQPSRPSELPINGGLDSCVLSGASWEAANLNYSMEQYASSTRT